MTHPTPDPTHRPHLEDLPVADGLDDPADLVVDPAEGVVRADLTHDVVDDAGDDLGGHPLDHVPSRPIEDVALPALPALPPHAGDGVGA